MKKKVVFVTHKIVFDNEISITLDGKTISYLAPRLVDHADNKNVCCDEQASLYRAEIDFDTYKFPKQEHKVNNAFSHR